MSKIEDLWSQITAHPDIKGRSGSGYHTMQCPMCNDSKVRAGFMNDGSTIVYNCFRGSCDATTAWEYGADKPLSRKLRAVLNVMGVSIPISLNMHRGTAQPVLEYDENLFEEPSYDPVELPSGAFRLQMDKNGMWQDYLYDRGITGGDFYIDDGALVVPFYHHKKLIGYKSFSRNGFRQSTGSDLVFFPNRVCPKVPIICEGEYDALSLPNAVAVGAATITRKQAWYFRNAQPILLPDRKGSRFMEVAKRYGWDIIIPDYKAWSVKDLNEAVLQYGTYVTARMLHESRYSADNLFAAEVKYNLWKQQ